jgi:asparagine synthase (glutamine-hydrolysing)
MGAFVFQFTPRVAQATQGWHTCGPCSARIVNNAGPSASMVHSPTGLAAGLVRLDNRHEMARLAGCDTDRSDLAIVVATLARRGVDGIRDLQGDFAFAYWDQQRETLIAARDAFGVRILYRRSDNGCQTFASQARLIGEDRPISMDYCADFIRNSLSETFTPYVGVSRVPAGTYCVLQGERTVEHCYWSAHDFDTDPTIEPGAAIEQFTMLFADGLRTRLAPDGTSWAQLSGGVDSSSMVSMAAWLARRDPGIPPIRGTLSYVDTLGDGDERKYSDAVVRAWPHRNEQLVDFGLWNDGNESPPSTDAPDINYPWFARDQAECRIVRADGGQTLLSGVGPDQYLGGNWLYFADRVAEGRVKETIRELYRLAVFGKKSFWSFAYGCAIQPFLRRNAARPDPWPRWIHPSFARRFPSEKRRWTTRQRPPAIGRFFRSEIANDMNSIEHSMFRGVIEASLDVRYPYLHRPLVEFCLRLPPELLIRPLEHKWILCQAMEGILPERVRRRRTKGFINGRIERSLIDQRARLHRLLDRSVLGELHCIDVRLAQDALSHPHTSDFRRLQFMLILETWLAVRSGQWAASEPVGTAGKMHSHVFA